MQVRAVFLLLTIFYLSVASALAQPHACEHPTLSALVKKADLIFIGRVQRTNSKDIIGHTSFWGVTDGSYRADYTIVVEHVFKGASSFEGRSLAVRKAPIVNSYSCPEPGSRGLIMVVSRDHNFAFVDPSYPIFPIAPSSGSIAAGTDALVSVSHLLTQFLASNPKSLRADALFGANWNRQQVYADVAEILRTVPTELVRSDLRAIVNSSQASQLQRLLAFDCLLFHQDFDSVEQLKNILSSPPDSSVAPYLVSTIPHGTMITPRASWLHFARGDDTTGKGNSVRQSPTFGTAMEKLVAAIAPLLRSSNLSTRQDVADVLSEIATPTVIDPLAKIALDDSDIFVRQCAISGLRLATRNEPSGLLKGGPSDVNEREVNFWRRWAAFKDHSQSPLSSARIH